MHPGLGWGPGAGNKLAAQVRALARESNPQPSGVQAGALSLSHTSQGLGLLFLAKITNTCPQCNRFFVRHYGRHTTIKHGP